VYKNELFYYFVYNVLETFGACFNHGMPVELPDFSATVHSEAPLNWWINSASIVLFLSRFPKIVLSLTLPEFRTVLSSKSHDWMDDWIQISCLFALDDKQRSAIFNSIELFVNKETS
jgi:hypothetical protein